MARLLQVWQYGDTGTLDQAIDAAKTSGFDGLLCKALDGDSWMRSFDPSPWSLHSETDVQAQRERCHAAGLKYYIWTVPRGDQDVDRQAKLTARAVLHADGLFIDGEPYSRFWGAWRPVGLARRFMEQLRALAPNAWIAFQPDPRPERLAELRPEEWIPYCDAIAGQHYWSDFQTSPLSEMVAAMSLGDLWGKPSYPTLPGNAPLDSFPLHSLATFPGFIVWRLGTTPPETLALLGGVGADVPTPETAPASSFMSLETALATVTRGDVRNSLAEWAARKRATKAQLRAAMLDAVGELDRIAGQFLTADR